MNYSSHEQEKDHFLPIKEVKPNLEVDATSNSFDIFGDDFNELDESNVGLDTIHMNDKQGSSIVNDDIKNKTMNPINNSIQQPSLLISILIRF